MKFEHEFAESNLAEQDRIVVIGAGGFTAENLYLRNLQNLNITPDHLVLVDTDEERLNAVHNRLGDAQAFLDTDEALEAVHEQGERVAAIIIASSTAAHADNLTSIVHAAEAGRLDLEHTKVWCEKPVTPPEIFDEVRALAAEHPDLDVSVGYILRFSETLSALEDYLHENELRVTGIDWLYGKDRTKDTRPSQGVFPDEIVHPLSVTDLVLSRAFGEVIGVDVETATIQRRDFVNQEVQAKARVTNPRIPEQPTSDIDTTMHYAFHADGTVTKIPVRISTSFLLKEEVRRVTLSVDGPNGVADELVVDFDVRQTLPDGSVKRTDTLRKKDGTVISEWSGDKSSAQLVQFFGILSGKDARTDVPTSLEGEQRIQDTLAMIGRVAAGNARPEF